MTTETYADCRECGLRFRLGHIATCPVCGSRYLALAKYTGEAVTFRVAASDAARFSGALGGAR